MKGRIFVLGKVHAGGMFHNPYADVADVFIGQQAVAVNDGARQHRAQAGEAEFQSHVPPKGAGERLLSRHMGDYGINDPPSHSQGGKRHQARHHAQRASPHEQPPGLIPKRCEAPEGCSSEPAAVRSTRYRVFELTPFRGPWLPKPASPSGGEADDQAHHESGGN